MPLLVQFNLLGAGLIAIQGAVLCILLLRNNGNRHLIAFLAFWSLASFFNFVDWGLGPQKARWLELPLDTLENFSLAMAAYSLLRGNDFDWREKNLLIAGLLTFVAVVLMVIIAILIQNESPFWKAIYISPNMLMSAGVFIAIGIGIIQQRVIGVFRWPLMLIFVVYAVVQLPIYVRFIAGDKFFSDAEVSTLRIFLGLGKMALLLTFTAAAISYVWELQPESRKDKFERSLKLLKLAAWLIGGAYTAITYVVPLAVKYVTS